RPFVVALFVRAGDHWAGLQILFNQEFISTAWALLWNRFVRRGELALRIIRAAIERVALTSAFLDQLAIFAVRALHAYEVLLHVLALGVPTASRELAVASVADHHVAAALRARLIERNIWNFLALIKTPRRFAIGVACAGHELAEASTLQHHH